MDKYSARRWRHALEYQAQEVIPLGRGHYLVKSSAGGQYRVSVVFSQGKLAWSACNCKDHGETQLHGVPWCKHAAAASIAEHLGKPFAKAAPEATLGTLLMPSA